MVKQAAVRRSKRTRSVDTAQIETELFAKYLRMFGDGFNNWTCFDSAIRCASFAILKYPHFAAHFEHEAERIIRVERQTYNVNTMKGELKKLMKSARRVLKIERSLWQS